MSIISRSWKERYKKLRDLTYKINLPLFQQIEIEQYIAKDLLLNQEVVVKKININENPDIKELAQYLWHYEISLNRKATIKSKGNTLLKLVDAQRDEAEGLYILITESGGRCLLEIFENNKDSCEDDVFNAFKAADKKTKWEAILKLAEGLFSLHSSGLIHRNISLNTVYFDGDSFSEGDPEVLRIGDFNWSIYLHSISNIVLDQVASEVIKDNIHFFRAPECIPDYIHGSKYGESYKSDQYSFGLVITFLLIELEATDYFYANSDQRSELYDQIIEEIRNYKGWPQEKEVLLKLLRLNPQERYKDTGELLDTIREFVEKLKHNFIDQPKLPVFYERERTKIFVQRASDAINMGIDALLKQPDEFLKDELSNKTLYLTNKLEYPLWTKGNSGLYYRFRRLYNRSKLARIEIFYPKQERAVELSNNAMLNVGKFYWVDKNEELPYLNWEQVFSNAFSQIKDTQEIITMESKKKRNWLSSLDLIGKAEEQLEESNIFEYELIDIEETDEDVNSNTKNIKIVIYNDEDSDSITELLYESQSNYIELLDSDYLFERFRNKRKWKILEIEEDTTETTVLRLEGRKRNEDVPTNGFVRLWELQNTIFLLKRKRQIIQNLEYNEHILNAVLLPARYHKYFEKYDSDNLISFIYYTYPIFLLQGPPGTGKTWHAKELIKKTLEKDPYSKILIASKEHSALDDLLEKCVKMISESKFQPNPYIIRLISPDREALYNPTTIPYNYFSTQVTKQFLTKLNQWNDSTYPELMEELKKSIKNDLISPDQEWVDLIKESCNLVFCTSTAYDLKELENMVLNFDLVIVEEAGKTYPSELFRPMELGDKWVLIGDQNQLPPFRIEDIVKILEENLSQIEEENINKPEFDSKEFMQFKQETRNEVKVFQSMFERFQKIRHSYDESDEIKSCDTLLDQHRLPSKISKMISTIFYDQEFNQKIEDPVNFILEPNIFKNEQLIWINTPSIPEFREKRTGVNLFNVGEARIISNLLTKLKVNEKYKPFKFAILSPYREQVAILKKYLPDNLPNFDNRDPRQFCYTVDSFQGQEADLVIISLVRNNNYETAGRAWGFIPKLERLNVMLSRAKKIEILVGNFDMCITHRGNKFMEKFVNVAKFIEREGVIIKHDEV
jgi:serine/threonine protein kinase